MRLLAVLICLLTAACAVPYENSRHEGMGQGPAELSEQRMRKVFDDTCMKSGGKLGAKVFSEGSECVFMVWDLASLLSVQGKHAQALDYWRQRTFDNHQHNIRTLASGATPSFPAMNPCTGATPAHFEDNEWRHVYGAADVPISTFIYLGHLMRGTADKRVIYTAIACEAFLSREDSARLLPQFKAPTLEDVRALLGERAANEVSLFTLEILEPLRQRQLGASYDGDRSEIPGRVVRAATLNATLNDNASRYCIRSNFDPLLCETLTRRRDLLLGLARFPEGTAFSIRSDGSY